MPDGSNRDITWDQESLEIEKLDCRNNAEHFDRLVRHVIGELTTKVISENELYQVSSLEEIRFFVREAVEQYDAKRHANMAWYAWTRLRFLVGKWKLQKKEKPENSD